MNMKNITNAAVIIIKYTLKEETMNTCVTIIRRRFEGRRRHNVAKYELVT